MKPTNDVLNSILGSRQFLTADLYTFTLANGTVLNYAGGGAQTDISYNSTVYPAGGQVGPYFDRTDNKAKVAWKLGSGNDQLVIDVIPGAASVGNLGFLDAVRCGVFDGADFQLSRGFIADATFGQSVAIATWSTNALTTEHGNWQGFTLRQVIRAAALLGGGDSLVSTQIRVTIQLGPSTGAGSTIIGYVGAGASSGNEYNFDGTQVPITVKGNTTITAIGGAQTIVSDWLAIPSFSSKRNLVVTLAGLTGTPSFANVAPALANTQEYFNFGNTAATTSVTADGTQAEFDAIAKVEVLPSLTTIQPGCAVLLFQGRVAEVDADRSIATFTINDYRELLTQQLPRNLFAASCANSFGDSSCTVNVASFSENGTIQSGGTQSVLNTTLTRPSDYYDQGKITFTSGVLKGLSFGVSTWTQGSPGQILLMAALPKMPAVGDAFTIAPGCDKTFTGGCTKYSNTANFRGEPYVPAPESAL